MSYVYVAVFAASLVIVVLALVPKPPQAQSPSLTDIEIPTAEEGRPVPVIFGVVTVTSPNIVWYGNIAYRAVRTKSGK